MPCCQSILSFIKPTGDTIHHHPLNHMQDCPCLPWNIDSSRVSFPKPTTPKLLPSPGHALHRQWWGLTSASVQWDSFKGFRPWGYFVAFQFKGLEVMWESRNCEGREHCTVPEQGWEDKGRPRVQGNTRAEGGKPCVVSGILLKIATPGVSYPTSTFPLRQSKSVLCRGKSINQLGKSIK